MINRAYVGMMGEIYAARYLVRKGWSLVSANYKSRFGEIDLIVRKRKILVFVEVKTRSPDSMFSPRETVDYQKQTKIVKTAMLFLQKEEYRKCQPQFDVIEVILDEESYWNEKKAIIHHYPNAFQSEGFHAIF